MVAQATWGYLIVGMLSSSTACRHEWTLIKKRQHDANWSEIPGLRGMYGR